MVARGVFIAGTDTGIGKTLIACALLRGLAPRPEQRQLGLDLPEKTP